MSLIIDSHIHFWRLARGDYTWMRPEMAILLQDHLPEDLSPQLRQAGVDKIVVVQAAETLAETEFTLGLASRYPMIAGVVGWVELAAPTVAADIARLAVHPLVKGFRPVRNDNASIAWMADTALDAGLRLLAERGLSLDILIQNPDELPIAIGLIERHPDIVTIIDHCAKPDIAARAYEAWARNLRIAASYPQVNCKFSGLLNRAAPGWAMADLKPYADHVLDCFGPGRLLWGSDWPPLRLAGDYANWWAVSQELLAGLSAADRACVLGNTARRVYRL
ncbi:MAG: amidohydrolase family protein [Gammaproteobacteria bacterium]